MWDDVIRIAVVLIVASLAYVLNSYLNPNAKAKAIIGAIVLAVGALFLISPLVDVVRQALSSVHK